MEWEIINYYGVKLNVGYEVNGKYIPATCLQPAEYPDLIIHIIEVEDSDVNICNIFSEEQIEDIVEKVNDKN